MATTVTAGQTPAIEKRVENSGAKRFIRPAWSRPGVRTRQIALITLLVAIVVVATTIINIAYLTDAILNRTQQQADQLSNQIAYAAQQELAHSPPLDTQDSGYSILGQEHSSVRGLMESTIVTSRQIVYLYVADEAGHILSDPGGQNQLAANRHMIGEVPTGRPDLNALVREVPLIQLGRVFLGSPIYEFRKRLSNDDGSFTAFFHVGVSASAVRRELISPITTNLIIGFVAIVVAGLVAVSSANLLLRPLRAISSSIDRLESGGEPAHLVEADLPRDEMVSGVATRIKQLGQRLAGERSELEIMRGRLRQVISHLEERLILLNRDGRVILASPDAEQVLGVTDVELTGLPIDESLGGSHPLVEVVERAFTERRSSPRTTLYVPNGSHTRQLLASVQYIEDAGTPVGALVSLRDYESFQKYESQWDLSKKLADLGRITSGIAHEVKNPLNAMVIHLEILRSKLDSGSGNPAPQIEILDSEIKRLDRVVATFLNFTRPVEVHLAPLNLNAIVSQVVALASTEANERGVTIKRDLVDGPLAIKGDADLLTQTLLNIIINGCQSMPEGGPLKVATTRRADGTARVAITDRGIGIAPDVREHIFNLYYTTKKGGTGIGLAQAFRAIQLHSGEISVTSEVGVGTTFEIILPAFA